MWSGPSTCGIALASEARARLEAQGAALTDRLTTAEQAQRKSARELETVQTELAAA